MLGVDPRSSTPALLGWFSAGAANAGATITDLGVVPTPAVAFAVPLLGADAGVVVSASHNPHPDNGIKLFDPGGFKWSSAEEHALEQRLAQEPLRRKGTATPPSSRRVTAARHPVLDRYLDRLAALVPPNCLAGQRIAVDSANGAASRFAAPLLRRLGADTVNGWDQPDGENIHRDCGATVPRAVSELTREHGCHFGVAFDGVADRAIFCDETGTVRDGDAVLYLWAKELSARGELQPARLVVTSMSNLGLVRGLSELGISCQRCDVGDRAVVEALRSGGLRLGGEPSGHIVDLAAGTTSDGLLTAVRTACLVAQSGAPFSHLLRGLGRYPQVLRNVRVTNRVPIAELPEVAALQAQVERELGEDGRLVVRYSGTEPLLRIMIEGPDEQQIEALAARLAAAVHRAVG